MLTGDFNAGQTNANSRSVYEKLLAIIHNYLTQYIKWSQQDWAEDKTYSSPTDKKTNKYCLPLLMIICT